MAEIAEAAPVAAPESTLENAQAASQEVPGAVRATSGASEESEEARSTRGPMGEPGSEYIEIR